MIAMYMVGSKCFQLVCITAYHHHGFPWPEALRSVPSSQSLTSTDLKWLALEMARAQVHTVSGTQRGQDALTRRAVVATFDLSAKNLAALKVDNWLQDHRNVLQLRLTESVAA